MLRTRTITIAIAIALASSLACATSSGQTRITSSWTEPSAGRLQFHRVLVAYITTDKAARRSIEDKLAAKIPNSFPSYNTVPELSNNDQALARTQLREKLFDGALVMRVVNAENREAYVPEANWYASSPSFYGYWGASWTMVHDPGYVVTNKVVSVETRIYNITGDKLVWAGRTSTENPPSLSKLVDETAESVTKELRKQGLIPP